MGCSCFTKVSQKECNVKKKGFFGKFFHDCNSLESRKNAEFFMELFRVAKFSKTVLFELKGSFPFLREVRASRGMDPLKTAKIAGMKKNCLKWGVNKKRWFEMGGDQWFCIIFFYFIYNKMLNVIYNLSFRKDFN